VSGGTPNTEDETPALPGIPNHFDPFRAISSYFDQKNKKSARYTGEKVQIDRTKSDQAGVNRTISQTFFSGFAAGSPSTAGAANAVCIDSRPELN